MLIALAAAAWVQMLWPSIGGDAMSGMVQSGAGVEGEAMDLGMDAEFSFADVSVGAVAFVGAWIVMMTAMMLPSTVPMVVLYRAMARGSPHANALRTSVFVLAYLVAWGAFGLAVYAVQRLLGSIASRSTDLEAAWPMVVAGVLASAGVYQFSRLKEMCLGRCRSPWSFLVERWRPGTWGGFELGLRHGVYCIGCCWALMAVLVVAGAMGLAWVTLIAVVIFAEKLLPPGRHAARVIGLALLGLERARRVEPCATERGGPSATGAVM
ncbi:MAG: DUF2182 domain-containing protein [Chloroflexi bacterium]|nr:DUF2182 domain-containing protein [Chloroflexota bacterium]